MRSQSKGMRTREEMHPLRSSRSPSREHAWLSKGKEYSDLSRIIISRFCTFDALILSRRIVQRRRAQCITRQCSTPWTVLLRAHPCCPLSLPLGTYLSPHLSTHPMSPPPPPPSVVPTPQVTACIYRLGSFSLFGAVRATWSLGTQLLDVNLFDAW